MEFFNNLEPLLRTFWFIAIPVSIIFLIQTVMTFIGIDGGDGIDADFDGDMHGGDTPFQIFSIRNLINFLLGFSWGGISFYEVIGNRGILITVALIIGAAFLVLFFVIIRQVQKLAEDNSFNINNVVGKTGTVYIRIPASRSGTGKVQVSVKGSFHELNAITENEEIPTGHPVRITALESNNLIIVTKI